MIVRNITSSLSKRMSEAIQEAFANIETDIPLILISEWADEVNALESQLKEAKSKGEQTFVPDQKADPNQYTFGFYEVTDSADGVANEPELYFDPLTGKKTWDW